MRHWVDIDIHIKINQRNIRASFFRFCLTNNIFWIGFDENGSKIVWFDQDSNFIEFFNRTQKLWTSRLRQLCRPQWLRRLLLKRCEAPTMREKKLKTNWAWMWMKNIFYNITLKIKKKRYMVDGAFSWTGWPAAFRKHADLNVNVRVRFNIKQRLCGGRTGNSIERSHWIRRFRNATRGTLDTKKSSICWPVNLIY